MPAWATDLRASVAYIPTLAEPPSQGPFIELVKAMDEVYSEGSISIGVYPFARSIQNVTSDVADFHLPMLRSPHYSDEGRPFRLMNKPMGQVCLVLYSHVDDRLTPQQLYRHKHAQPYPYRLSIMRGSAQFIDLPVEEVNRIEQGLRQTSLKRVHGFLGAQEEADQVLRELQLKSIHRSLFECYDDVIILPKGERGRRTEAILQQALETLEAQGRLRQLHRKVHQPYQDWQIYDPPFGSAN
ncbi:MAG: hypothetical protein R3175_08850 [Marinobacter sp.]|uniref:hypothetical protein n=1 Tax=Marinobacter sp. TaxID=50741 RepID=UPI00299E7980|nr:hypothetical protein [Marinobacter sp.]MDX1756152.1 hypothetical protein [Marinobacter sp.]